MYVRMYVRFGRIHACTTYVRMYECLHARDDGYGYDDGDDDDDDVVVVVDDDGDDDTVMLIVSIRSAA